MKAEKLYRDEDFYHLFSKIYSEITEKRKASWLNDGLPERGIAYNPKSGVIFKGVNSLILEMRASQKGFTDSRWMSMFEIDKLGIKVKTGEIPTPVAYVNKYAPPTNVNPVTGNTFDNKNPRQKYYFMYNVEQLIGCELTNSKDFIISKDITVKKIKNVIENTKTNNFQEINNIATQKAVKLVPAHMAELAAILTRYRLAQEFHIPYKSQISDDTFKSLLKPSTQNVHDVLRTVYQAEISKDRLLSVGQQLEKGLTRTVTRTNERNNQNVPSFEQ